MPATTVAVVVDLLERFPSARVDGAAATEIRRPVPSDGVLRDALFTHPGDPTPARVAYALDLPPVAPGERLLLAFDTALSDGIPPDGRARLDGVRFSVEIDGVEAFARVVDRSHWEPAALDLTAHAGRGLRLTLVAAPRGNIAYDWALWGRPRILRLPAHDRSDTRWGIAALDLRAPATVTVRAGATTVARVDAAPGPCVLTLEPAEDGGPLALEVVPPDALVPGSLRRAPWPSAVHLTRVGVADPAPRAGAPLRLRAEVVNDGAGVHAGGERVVFTGDGATVGTRTVPRLAPGHRAWLEVTVPGRPAGAYRVAARWGAAPPVALSVTVHAAAVRRRTAAHGFHVERGDRWARLVRGGRPVAVLAPLDPQVVLQPVPGQPLLRMSAPDGVALPTVWAFDGAIAEGMAPGIEWLSSGEASSNPRGFGPGLADRRRPPMEHLCAPVLAVASGPDARRRPLNPPRFFCPDSLRGGVRRPDPAKMVTVGLFWDASPAARPRFEAPCDTALADASALEVGGVRAATVVVAPGPTLTALRLWLQARGGLPAPVAPPLSLERARDLCRTGFETLWDPQRRQWKAVLEGVPEPIPGIVALHLWDALHGGPARSRERAEAALTALPPAHRADRAAMHLLRWELPLLAGSPDDAREAFAALDAEIAGLRASQQPDGGWRFGAKAGPQASLGDAGDAVCGIASHAAWMLLRHARVTGDARSREAGRRAVAFLRRFHLPRGASVWECPIYEPDVLAAGWNVAAGVEGYLATADPAFVHEARYWAESALPFVYLWDRPDRPAMRGASIATYGTTFYLHSWIGRPVQWEGLLLAWHLRQLADVLESPERFSPGTLRFGPDDWRRVADLMLASGLHQQERAGARIGTYPDSVVDFREPQPVFLNPENLMALLMAKAGHAPQIRTADFGGIVLSSMATVEGIRISGPEAHYRLRLVPGATINVLARLASAPAEVRVDGARVETAWDPQTRRLFVPVRFAGPTAEVAIRRS